MAVPKRAYRQATAEVLDGVARCCQIKRLVIVVEHDAKGRVRDAVILNNPVRRDKHLDAVCKWISGYRVSSDADTGTVGRGDPGNLHEDHGIARNCRWSGRVLQLNPIKSRQIVLADRV